MLDTLECRVDFEKILLDDGKILLHLLGETVCSPKTTHYPFTFLDGTFLFPGLKLR